MTFAIIILFIFLWVLRAVFDKEIKETWYRPYIIILSLFTLCLACFIAGIQYSLDEYGEIYNLLLDLIQQTKDDLIILTER